MTVLGHKKAEYSIQQWGEVVFGDGMGLSTGYLSDRTVPWSENAFEMVLRTHDGTVPGVDDRREIIGEIAAIFMRETGPRDFEVPMVHFKGQCAHVTAPDTGLMEVLWKEQPVFRGEKMKLVSKGFVESNITVYGVWGMPAKERQELIKSFTKSTKKLAALIVADMYYMSEVSGELITNSGPLFSGDMLIFGRVGFGDQKSFLGEPFLKIPYPTVD